MVYNIKNYILICTGNEMDIEVLRESGKICVWPLSDKKIDCSKLRDNDSSYYSYYLFTLAKQKTNNNKRKSTSKERREKT
jgi:hypothetical protein